MLAALLHDVGHNGTTNKFHVDTGSELALRYNDTSVQENFHSSLGWKLLQESKLLDNIPKSDVQFIRQSYIQLVLCTDLAKHFDELAVYQGTTHGELDEANEEHRKLIAKMVLKCSDLSNPARTFGVTSYWAAMVQEEFFLQVSCCCTLTILGRPREGLRLALFSIF